MYRWMEHTHPCVRCFPKTGLTTVFCVTNVPRKGLSNTELHRAPGQDEQLYKDLPCMMINSRTFKNNSSLDKLPQPYWKSSVSYQFMLFMSCLEMKFVFSVHEKMNLDNIVSNGEHATMTFECLGILPLFLLLKWGDIYIYIYI